MDEKHIELVNADIRDDTLRREQWRKAVCPICSREFLHLAAYKPSSCQELACALKAREAERAADWRLLKIVANDRQQRPALP